MSGIDTVVSEIATVWQKVVQDVQIAKTDATSVINNIDNNIGTIATVLATIAGILALLPTNPALAIAIADLNGTTEAVDAYIAARNAGMSIADAVVKGVTTVNTGLGAVVAAVEKYGEELVDVFSPPAQAASAMDAPAVNNQGQAPKFGEA